MLKHAFASLLFLFATTNIAVAQEIAEGTGVPQTEEGQLGLLAIILLFVVTVLLQELILFVLAKGIKRDIKNEILAEEGMNKEQVTVIVKSEFKKRFSSRERIQFYCWSAILFMTFLVLFAVPINSLYLTFFCIIISAEVLQLLIESFSFFNLRKLITSISPVSLVDNYLNDDSTIGDLSTVGNSS